MTTFKKMKMRINNPEHSKAVQEWLFKQGYEWVGTNKGVFKPKFHDLAFLFTGTDSQNSLTYSGKDDEGSFNRSVHEEVDVQYLDPHLFTVHKSSKVPAQSSFDNMLKNLKHVQKAIEKADNKQQKRLQDRDKMLSKINEMLPEGFVVKVAVEEGVKFDPEEIVEGSVWECIDDDGCPNYWTIGAHYKVTYADIGAVNTVDDEGDVNGHNPEYWLNYFKRIS